MGSGDLIDENGLILLDDGQVHGLPKFFRQGDEKRPRQRHKVRADGCRQPKNGRTETHLSVWRSGDDELFDFERRDNALHR